MYYEMVDYTCMLVILLGIMLINIQTEPYVILQINHERLRYKDDFTMCCIIYNLFSVTYVKKISLNYLQVRFVCSEPKAMISSITELSTCKYALTVRSPMLCQHP